MNNKWKWLIGVSVTVTLIIALFGAQSTWGMANRYGMMNGYSWNMPMMYGDGMMGAGMFFVWLIGLAVLVFLILAIAWLV